MTRRRKKATQEELEMIWQSVEDYWDKNTKLGDIMDYPWTRARFHLGVFKTTLSQKGWKVPSELGGPL